MSRGRSEDGCEREARREKKSYEAKHGGDSKQASKQMIKKIDTTRHMLSNRVNFELERKHTPRPSCCPKTTVSITIRRCPKGGFVAQRAWGVRLLSHSPRAEGNSGCVLWWCAVGVLPVSLVIRHSTEPNHESPVVVVVVVVFAMPNGSLFHAERNIVGWMNRIQEVLCMVLEAKKDF